VGAVVSAVEKGGPAEKAGLKSGDIILKVAGKEVDQSTEVPGLIAGLKQGTNTQLEIWRDRKRTTVSVTIGELGEKTVASASQSGEAGGKLGLAVRPLTPEESKQAKVDGGVVVQNAQGAAARAGIQSGDVILGVNGQTIHNIDELREAVSKSNDVVALLVQRNDARIYVPVRTG
jgi:serine protease Do